MKWRHVAPFLLDADSQDATRVRDAFGEQTLVLSDPMERIRELDMRLLDSGGVALPICGLTITAHGNRRLRGSGLAHQLSEFVSRDLLSQSGIGTISYLIRAAQDWWDSSDDSTLPSPEELIGTLDGNLHRVTRLATQAMALVVHERDPDSTALSPYPWAEEMPMRFISGDDPWLARRRLKVIASSNVIFDRDEPPVTEIVEGIRLSAHAASSPYSWLSDHRSPVGRIRTGDDAENLRLQLADVAAGWASAIIERYGLLGLATRFRLVLYNGEKLTLEEAARLDRIRSEHRRLLVAAPGQ